MDTLQILLQARKDKLNDGSGKMGFNTLKPEQQSQLFSDDIFICVLLKQKFYSVNCLDPAGDKLSSEPISTLFTGIVACYISVYNYICVLNTRKIISVYELSCPLI